MNITKPTEISTLERAKRLCTTASFLVVLQYRRMRIEEPEDGNFMFRVLADFQFFITALMRLRKSAEIATKAPSVKKVIRRAITDFENAVPNLTHMRDVLEHIDDYAQDNGKHTWIERQQLEVAVWDGTTYDWLGIKFNIETASVAAEKLFLTIRDIVDQHLNASDRSTLN
ncbi:hypothetical protein [Larkinella sp.]|uniref:hypothetical protein n=1 Tax=Larkinella sp. TaxID=2034517 RepID=UPI003BAA2EAE